MKTFLASLLFVLGSLALAQSDPTSKFTHLWAQETLTPPRAADCSTLKTPQRVGSLCYDTDADPDGDGTAGAQYECKSIVGGADRGACSSWVVDATMANVSGADYVLWKSGSTYYSRATATGTVTSGADAGALIQAAATALAATGGTISVRAGTYVLTTSSSFGGTTNVAVKCADGATFQRSGSMLSAPMFTASTSVSGWSVTGCTFDNNGQATTAADISSTGGGSDIQILSNRFINGSLRSTATGAPVRIVGTTGSSSYRLTIDGNLFEATPSTSAEENAVQVNGWSDVSISGNRIYAMGSIKYDASSAQSYDVYRLRINNNEFRQVNVSHVLVRPSGTAGKNIYDVEINGNVASYEGAQGVNKKGFAVIGEQQSGTTNSTVVRDVVISNNTIRGLQGAGITFGGSNGYVENATISGNVLDGRDSTGAIPTDSIFLPISVGHPMNTQISIVGNSIAYAVQSCILVGGKTVTVSGNTLSYCVQGEGGPTNPTRSSAILTNELKNATISGNTIYRPFTAALAASYLTGGITINKQLITAQRDIILSNNTIIDDRDDGVSDLDGDGTTAASDERGMEYGIKFGVDNASSVAENVVATNNFIKGATAAAFYDAAAESSVLNRLQWGNLYDWAPVTPRMPTANTIVFEGITADSFETTLTVTDPTADRTVTVPNVSGTVGIVDSTVPSGSLIAASGTGGSGGLSAADLTSAASDIDGNGTATTADWDANGTADETGLYSASNARFARVVVPGSNRYDISGDGTTETVPIDLSLHVAADAHALLYGIPRFYRLPALFDPWTEVFMGRALIADCDSNASAGGAACAVNESTTLSQCYAQTCAAAVPTALCITTTDATDDTLLDWDNDGTAEMAPGDVFSITVDAAGETTRGRQVYRYVSNTNGTNAATNCPVGVDNQITISPDILPRNDGGYDIDANGVLDTGAAIVTAWKNDTHPSNHFAYHLGYRLGYASRDMYGAQGPNLLRNGQMDYDGSMQNWTVGGGSTFTTLSWDNTPTVTSPANDCYEGTAGGDCFYSSNTSGPQAVVSVDPIDVQPGDTLILRYNGRFQNTSSIVGLWTDPEGDGTFASDASLLYALTATDYYPHYQNVAQAWQSWTIPEGRHQVKVAFTPGGATATNPVLDDVQLVKATTWQSGNVDRVDFIAHTCFLINDPGERTIIVTGDSWAKTTAWGDDVVAGLAAALNTRFGRTITTQIKATGMGSQTTAGLLSANTCDSATWTFGGGSENCWYTQIERYKPLYVIVILGTNDATGGITAAAYASRMMEIGHRIAAMGAIPILVGPSPIGANASANFTAAHNLRNALLLKWRGMTP